MVHICHLYIVDSDSNIYVVFGSWSDLYFRAHLRPYTEVALREIKMKRESPWSAQSMLKIISEAKENRTGRLLKGLLFKRKPMDGEVSD
jgi:hypothetical protein